MNGTNKGMSCQSGCWALAAGVGFLTFVLLLVVGTYGIIASIFLSGVAFLILGFAFSAVFCAPLTKPGEVAKPGTEARPRPAEAAAAAATAPAAHTRAPAASTHAPAAPGAAGADADADAGAKVKPSKTLPGQKELSEKKGSWKYGEKGGSDATPSPGKKPETLDAPRAGQADDLKKIKGIGPKLEELCNSLGFYHFDQIANWSAEEVAWVDDNLEGFKGRVTRDDWVAQAKTLAGGGDTEFSNRVDKGDVY